MSLSRTSFVFLVACFVFQIVLLSQVMMDAPQRGIVGAALVLSILSLGALLLAQVMGQRRE